MLPAHSYPNLKKFATWPNPPVVVPIYWDSWRNNVSNIGFQWDFRHNIVGNDGEPINMVVKWWYSPLKVVLDGLMVNPWGHEPTERGT
jgi:hypothetical protein